MEEIIVNGTKVKHVLTGELILVLNSYDAHPHRRYICRLSDYSTREFYSIELEPCRFVSLPPSLIYTYEGTKPNEETSPGT
jgi:hypothetical protein